MKYPILLVIVFLAFFINGCGSHSQSSCSPSQDPYQNGKLQVNSLASVAATAVNSAFQINLNQTIDISAVSIPAGTELVAVVKNSCLNKSSGGVTSVPWLAPRDFLVSELSASIENDACVVGLSDKLRLDINQDFVDPLIAEQTHLQTIDSAGGNDVFFGSDGINKDSVIAIIDTGVDVTHEDLKPNLWINPGEIAANQIDDDKNGFVDDINGWNFGSNKSDPSPEGGWKGNYHGTHVAGLAAAKGDNHLGGSGVMGEHAKLMALNVFGVETGALNSNIDNAIRYAADNGADVINLSLGGPGRASSTESAMTYALGKGVTVIVAAGNGNSLLSDKNFQTPASFSGIYSGVIAIGSVDDRTFKRSYFSNYGSSIVKLAAPGSDSINRGGLMSTLPGNKYGRLQGTSMASPVAAGAAGLAVGLIKARGVKPTPSIIERVLSASAREIDDLAPSFKDGGVLNLKNLAQVINTQFPGGGVNMMASTVAETCH